MVEQVYLDQQHDRLVFIDRPADEGFWDDRWAQSLTAADIRKKSVFVQHVTRKYLSPPDRVIDVGCGVANTVFGLHHAGFEAYGLDFAPVTIARIKKHAPELNIVLGDVREMPFEDAFFEGVWSLGVIEHFKDGYASIIEEARRVLKPGGLLFLTVPSVSPLRRLKMRLGRYEDVSAADMARFYQFAFTPNDTIRTISGMGFRLLESRSRGGYLGLMRESNLLKRLLEPLYESRSRPMVTLRRAIDLVISPVSFHTKLFVFKKH
ncbi:class I SAM-dependent methyltransferase [Mesorhizobium sp.]|uniref:class I SAM-dependent methyltransferase n=1 Tax=Mesorhizobium sp. TaxID=1871066 RepID=UPI000FE5B023|nr:class I SAM-dependent methyltransferase [Mesorhizobium sp.]RWO81562.1 MAG: class I SAM-dependent methyltransferase [Mesorhizobium sp.]